MAFDVEKAIREIDDLSTEEQTTLRNLFGKSQKLQARGLRQDEFDRRFNESKAELAAKDEAVARRQQELEAQFAELATWKTGEDTTRAQIDAEFRQLKADQLAAKQALERAAADAGKDVGAYLATRRSDEVVVAPVKDVVRDERGQFVSREDLGRTVAANIRADAQLLDIAMEHQRLFGEPLPSTEKLVDGLMDEARRGNKNATYREVWEKSFEVGKKRQEMADAAVQRRIDDAVTAERQRLMSDAALNGNRLMPGQELPTLLKDSMDRRQERGSGSHASQAAAAYLKTKERLEKQLTGA